MLSPKCARCRRRKIRCSGDKGDGFGCDNCKSTGKALECTFVRVRSNLGTGFYNALSILTSSKVLSYPLGLEVRTSNEHLGQTAECSPNPNGMTCNFPQRFMPNSNWVNEPHPQAPEYNVYSTHSRAAPANQISIRSASTSAATPVDHNNSGFEGFAAQSQCCTSPSHGLYSNISSSNMSNYAPSQAPYCNMSDPGHMNRTSHGLPPFGMTPLYSSLPTNATSDRQLPIPSTGRLPIPHSGLSGSVSSQGSSYRGSFSWANEASSQSSQQTNPRYSQSTMSGSEFRQPYSPTEPMSPLGYSTYRTEASPTSAVSTRTPIRAVRLPRMASTTTAVALAGSRFSIQTHPSQTTSCPRSLARRPMDSRQTSAGTRHTTTTTASGPTQPASLCPCTILLRIPGIRS